MAKKQKSTKDTIELRRWCIEQAARWPVSPGNYGMMGGTYKPEGEADLIGRAERLLSWVTR